MQFTFHNSCVIIKELVSSTVILWTELSGWRKCYSNKATLLLSICLHIVMSGTYCVVCMFYFFFLYLFVFILCLVHGGVRHIFVFLFCFVWFRLVSCAPYVSSLCFQSMFPVSLRCPFLIAPSVSLAFINGINTFVGERMFKKIEKSVMISIQDDFCSMTLLWFLSVNETFKVLTLKN